VEHLVVWCQQWKTKILREEPVPMPLGPPKIPLELAWDRMRPLRSATNHLGHGTTAWWQASEFVPFGKHLHNFWLIDWLINSPDAPRPYRRALCAPLISAQESPIPLLKFQMVPRLKIWMASGSKKGTQIYSSFLSKVPVNEPPPCTTLESHFPNSNLWQE
jgi:hypothetical protein